MSLLALALALLAGATASSLALAVARAPRAAELLATAGAVVACGLGLVPAVRALAGGPEEALELAAAAPLGTLRAGLDPLSAFFLVPLFALGALAAVYGRAYLATYRGRKSPAVAAALLNALIASMVVVVTARNALLFLVAWEAMTLTSYLLVTFEHEEPEVRRAGWVYLVAAHIGVACLIVLFLLLDARGGGLDFDALAAGARTLGPGAAVVMALLAGVGFSVKAGVVPLHVWLPEAHAAAPSHVSALMSGVLIKMGLYGMLRAGLLLQPPMWWGHVLLALGVASALGGILLAVSQRDLKRVLAYSSVENMGVIFIGLGAAMWARGRGETAVAALALSGALLHVWNHAAMKPLMFLCAGSVLYATHTRDLERLGGLLSRMPVTGAAALLGAVAMSALPPLNGFASEWLLYLGLGRMGMSSGGWPGATAMLCVGVLAFTGGLAVLTFTRLAGVAFLGEPRSEAARAAHEPSGWMTGPTLLLGMAVVAGGLLPGFAVRALSGAAAEVLGDGAAPALGAASDSLRVLGLASGAVWIAAATVGLALLWLTRRPAASVGTWDCGYAAPSPRMQYTASSFSEIAMTRLVPPALRPRALRAPLAWLFPRPSRFATATEDPLTRGAYAPFFSAWAERFARIRWMQQGVLHIYMVYILAVVVLALGWASVREWLAP